MVQMDRENPTTRFRMRQLLKLARDQRGATTLEWALLLGVIAIPSYYIIQAALSALVAHYQMVTTLNALPFP
jgi:Flp pilus assembly pilin Flp